VKSMIEELDELLIGLGKYPDKNELMKDALRALLRAKPDLKKDIAVELYRRKEVSLSRAAEIYGSNIEDFKELLKERGVKIEIPHLSTEEIDKEVESILLL
jgi:predicted HTH domain antitoxin